MTSRARGRSAEERFWAKVNLKDGFCWTWTGYIKPNGYASFYPGGGRGVPKVYAHRFAYELAFGEIPPGMEIDHLCNVRHCVNPDHLEVVDHRTNLDRAIDRRTHCKNGHSFEDAYVISGNRVCRGCRIETERARRARQRAA